MKLRRQIPAVLANFLSAYTSRYSDYDGYWLFGRLLAEGDSFDFELGGVAAVGNTSPRPLVSFAGDLARKIFWAQVDKSVVPAACFSRVGLRIHNTSRRRTGPVNHRPMPGFEVVVTANAISDLGKAYTQEAVVFVAPHDPAVEHRSSRRTPPPAGEGGLLAGQG